MLARRVWPASPASGTDAVALGKAAEFGASSLCKESEFASFVTSIASALAASRTHGLVGGQVERGLAQHL